MTQYERMVAAMMRLKIDIADVVALDAAVGDAQNHETSDNTIDHAMWAEASRIAHALTPVMYGVEELQKRFREEGRLTHNEAMNFSFFAPKRSG